MPFAYGPMPRPYTEGPNPVGSFLNTLGGIQQIEAGASKNALMQRELEAQKQVGNIMAGEGTLEEKWEKVMAISPEKAQKMAQSIKAGPMFRQPDAVTPGAVVERDGFVFADLLAGDDCTRSPILTGPHSRRPTDPECVQHES